MNSIKFESNKILLFFCLFPALLTFVSFTLQIGYPWTYGSGKVFMVIIPLFVFWRKAYTRREIVKELGIIRTKGLLGLSVGLLFASVILLLYYIIFKPLLNPDNLIEKITSLGLDGFYWPMCVFLGCINSFVEEFYWRGFLANLLSRRIASILLASLLAGVLFGLHHVFPLLHYFTWPQALLFSVGTVIASFIWTLMRLRGVSIIDCYISHIIADFSIFWVGWTIIQTKA
ncbi:MAG: CPBP family intramembrane metalloprotease [Candidatus Theseobacter exili]|nr:CPBP family intramembrane metalloprotease [Candidatus Theseobacter exili]